jgi:hypothetical protein
MYAYLWRLIRREDMLGSHGEEEWLAWCRRCCDGQDQHMSWRGFHSRSGAYLSTTNYTRSSSSIPLYLHIDAGK